MFVMPDWLRWSLEWSVMGLPLGVYLLTLGSWQKRLRQPALVCGTYDFLGLLLGLSGFFLLGPPTWILHSLRWLSTTWYWTGYILYMVALAILARWLLRLQQARTIIYAVHPEDAQDALEQAVKEFDGETVLVPGRVYWPQHQALLDVSVSPMLDTVTLRWLGGELAWRKCFERALGEALADKEAYCPVALIWLLLGAILVGLGVFHLLIWGLVLWLRG